jgi:hypothetical protein
MTTMPSQRPRRLLGALRPLSPWRYRAVVTSTRIRIWSAVLQFYIPVTLSTTFEDWRSPTSGRRENIVEGLRLQRLGLADSETTEICSSTPILASVDWPPKDKRLTLEEWFRLPGEVENEPRREDVTATDDNIVESTSIMARPTDIHSESRGRNALF